MSHDSNSLGLRLKRLVSSNSSKQAAGSRQQAAAGGRRAGKAGGRRGGAKQRERETGAAGAGAWKISGFIWAVLF